MKANELMTGDWVQVKDCIDQSYYFDEYEPGEIVQVREILDYGINPNWAGAEVSGILDLEDIQPIPITPEILEKNGFKHYHPENKKAEYWKLFTNGGDINVKKTYGFYRFRIYGKPIKPDAALPSFNGHLYNVHQLQHALRLCGIEKEIVL